MTATVAAIDCGTNSIRLLVSAQPEDGSPARDVLRRMEVVRLGQGVDRTGRLDPAALERTRAALQDYAGEIERHGAQRIRMVATSATRDAANRSDFERMVADVLGQAPEVITGAEEAALSFAGATESLRRASPGLDAPPPYLVVDIGGGSTEFVLGDTDVEASVSIDIGCVRLTERHLAGDPPTPDQIGAAEADIRAGLLQASGTVPLERAGTLVGLAGSVTTVAALALKLAAYDSDAIHQSRIPVAAVRSTAAGLLTATRARRAELPVMHPGRVDVIGAGAMILRVIMDALALDSVLASEHDILDGIAASLR